jgi:hypothetical protein
MPDSRVKVRRQEFIVCIEFGHEVVNEFVRSLLVRKRLQFVVLVMEGVVFVVESLLTGVFTQERSAKVCRVVVMFYAGLSVWFGHD